MKYIFLFVAVLFLLSGCNDNRDRTVGVADYEIKAEDCVVKYIDNPKGYNFFIAKCPASSETLTYQRPQGKGSVPTATVMTSDDLRKQLAEVEAKEKALAKLTIQEKVLLGIKE
jgi:hypothetical protein